MKRAVNQIEVNKRWDLYELPACMDGDTFLDVGCWAGGFLVEAVMRGSSRAVGIDSVRSPAFDMVIDDRDHIEFMPMDVFSPHWLSLPRFDIVLCAGVIYHVLNPVGLLQRLKAVVKDTGRLFLETVVEGGDHPSFRFCPDNSLDGNYSNWFVPTPHLLFKLAEEVGLFHVNSFMLEGGRAVFTFEVSDSLPMKYLPRKKEYMKQ